jgi:hypothetical protein
MGTFELDVFLEHAFHHFILIFASERGVARDHHEENNAGRPNIALLSVAFAEHFRGNVVGSAETGI